MRNNMDDKAKIKELMQEIDRLHDIINDIILRAEMHLVMS